MVSAYSSAMSISGDSAAAAFAATRQHLSTGSPDSWVNRTAGVMACVTGVPIAALNGVWTEQLSCTETTVELCLDQVAETGLPHRLLVRPGLEWDAARLATDRGLVRQDDVPLMALVDRAAIGPADPRGAVSVRQLSPDEAALHARVAAEGFAAPVWMFTSLITRAVLALPGVRCYVVEVDGDAVATGLGVTVNDSVGIFNVATHPDHRRRGHGAAVTMRALSDGFAGGADWAWLESSAQGLGIYERLGFRLVETRQCWESAP